MILESTYPSSPHVLMNACLSVHSTGPSHATRRYSHFPGLEPSVYRRGGLMDTLEKCSLVV